MGNTAAGAVNEVDSWMLAFNGAGSGAEGKRGGKSKADAERLNKTNTHRWVHSHLSLKCSCRFTATRLCVFRSDSLSWQINALGFSHFKPFLWGFPNADLTETKSQPQNCLAAFSAVEWKRSVSGLTLPLPELCRPSGRHTVPKNVQCQWAQCRLSEPFREWRQLKLKVQTLFTAWSLTKHSFVVILENNLRFLLCVIDWFSF